jgi:predicted pyridoxine 5'-phosphate oxidase superfamily flavin-nucleotide-binding protein
MVVIDSKAKNIIENNPVALSTINSDGTPNVIAVACVKVVSKNQILITDNFMKQTRENILANPHVCTAVWDKDCNGYKFVGKAEYHMIGKWKDYVKIMPENKGLAAKGAIIINISKIIKLY